MVLKNTMQQMFKYLENLKKDLDKASRGNKTAAQRVRTGSINFAKIAKLYRKESVAAEKKVKKSVKKKSKKR